ncbi:hypothetical protein PIB30_054043 [Stylosanthes scabra]|uniref:IPT/TIG domain-containing protein n=1 Tax=Stylosanthes scabra TaxID=79078 RepID=A0ABU6SIJ3_9FABA|nr:hypothetical protein [Stylosanthes scabra]
MLPPPPPVCRNAAVAVEGGRDRVPYVQRREKHFRRERDPNLNRKRERSPSISATVLELHSTGVHGGSFVADEKRRHHHQNPPPFQPPPAFFEVTGGSVITLTGFCLARPLRVGVAGPHGAITTVVNQDSRYVTPIHRGS